MKELGNPEEHVLVGDADGVRPMSMQVASALAVNKANAPFLGEGKGDCCKGAVLKRFNRATVGIPCYETKLADSEYCQHCVEIWNANTR